MKWSIDSALEDDLVDVVERDDNKAIYVVRFGPLTTTVTITLELDRLNQTTYFTQSHGIKTPVQGEPYWTSFPGGDSPGNALHKAIWGFTMNFRTAVELGHTPSEDWFVLATRR